MYHSVFFTHSSYEAVKGFFSYNFVYVTEGFSFAVIMQLSHDSVVLVMFALLFCIISVTQVIIFNHTAQLNKQT